MIFFLSFSNPFIFILCTESLEVTVNGKKVSFTLDKTVFLSTAALLSAK